LLSVVGTYLFSSPHTAATLFRLYGEKDTRRRYLFAAWIAPAILLAAFALALHIPAIASVLATAYLVLIWHHVMAQCYGLALMYCARSGQPLSGTDRFYPTVILYLSVTTAIAQQFTQSWKRQTFLGVALTPTVILPEWLIAVLQAALAVTLVLFFKNQLSRQKNGLPKMPLPAVLLLLNGAVLMMLTRSISEFVWIFIPAFFHGSQYLAVSLAYRYKSAGNNWRATVINFSNQIANRYIEYFLLGVVIFTTLPLIVASFGFPFSLSSALIFFIVNLHHFLADACIWKHKDRNVAAALKLMINRQG